jgi:hypothetical protein
MRWVTRKHLGEEREWVVAVKMSGQKAEYAFWLRRQIDHTAHLLKNRHRLDGGLNMSTVCCESDG